MGKQRGASKVQRHDPLYAELATEAGGEKLGARPIRAKFLERKNRTEQSEEFVGSSLSKKILNIAREQQDEMAEGEEDMGGVKLRRQEVIQAVGATADSDSEEEEEIEEVEEFIDLDGGEADMMVDADQEAILSRFIPSAPGERQNLADLIMAKIRAHEAGAGADNEEENALPPGVNPKVAAVYGQVAQLLSRYKSGRLPKAFKIIPSLANWEDILYLTEPDKWTPHAVFQATRIFVSNLKPKQSQRFFSLVLLDRVRDDIQDNKKLNYHLYMSMKKALYKASAFFKGILFPLCESGTCTLREAVIIGSVLAKVSIPMLHSAAALLRLAEMEYTGPNSLFIRTLLDKKYALPYKVVDALVFHFIRFRQDPRDMPVLWHQSLLVFCQRYKQDLTPEQKEVLMELLRYKQHEAITPEIRRELIHAVSRDDVMEGPPGMMMMDSD
ncbi:Bystin-domain-containing protein [Piptocephalis cylindrospora]|uniref:Bystin n=1 Tax=Piptocephalis cylindrospora TaxID=1907219 RepID=A0A4P9Y875_9FUNG|nr:Bystin-domain-containing protein [Piptocephalis cylindrospora]|eukprot:RKP14992.1 Bystin-domain-containing protein [Piptocephalis cylindrospora]